MRSRISSALMLGAILLTGGVHAATTQASLRGDTALVVLDPMQPYRTQFRNHAGQEFAVDGIVSGITHGDTPGFLLQNEKGQTLVVSAPQDAVHLTVGQHVHLVAHIPDAGVTVTALSITGPGLSAVVASAVPPVAETPLPVVARVETPPAEVSALETAPSTASDIVAAVETPVSLAAAQADMPPAPGEQVATPKKAAPTRPTQKVAAKKAMPAVKPAAKPVTPAPGSSEFAQQLASYTAKIRQVNRSVSNATAKKIAYAVLVKSPRFGVDPRLVFALIAQESRFNPRAVSPVGAQGLGQLMPGTAIQVGVRNAFDIYENVEGTVRYLAKQLQQFHGNMTYALAAYNAGPGNVMRYGGVPPFSETQNYIRLISTHYNKLTVQTL